MSIQFGGVTIERSRSGWDIVWGILLIIAGIVILTHAVAATTVSVLFLGWMATIGGLVALIASLFRIGKDGFVPMLISGALMLVIGIVMLRNPAATALTLTLLAGTLFLVTGVIRIITGFQVDEGRWILVFSGAISLILGGLVVFNLFKATLVLLGVLLGVQALVDGITMLILGRWRVTENAAAPVETS